eukprot:6202560-Pleurochrysis_carterae.AAC.1
MDGGAIGVARTRHCRRIKDASGRFAASPVRQQMASHPFDVVELQKLREYTCVAIARELEASEFTNLISFEAFTVDS